MGPSYRNANAKKTLYSATVVILTIATVMAIVFLTRPSVTFPQKGGDVSAEVALGMINSGVMVVDVRLPEEYSLMHINGALTFPYYNMTDFSIRLGSFSGKQDERIVLYCRTGIKSKNAWLYMNSTGYTNVYNMLGGISAWRASNYPVWETPSRSISLKEAYNMIEFGPGAYGTFPNLVVLDVRDAPSYEAGHLPNAINVFYANDFDFRSAIDMALSGKENSEIVIYCDGRGCDLSSMSASVLIEKQFQSVYWIPEGFNGWANAGYPVT